LIGFKVRQANLLFRIVKVAIKSNDLFDSNVDNDDDDEYDMFA